MGLKSGAQHTVTYALEQGREVLRRARARSAPRRARGRTSSSRTERASSPRSRTSWRSCERGRRAPQARPAPRPPAPAPAATLPLLSPGRGRGAPGARSPASAAPRGRAAARRRPRPSARLAAPGARLLGLWACRAAARGGDSRRVAVLSCALARTHRRTTAPVRTAISTSQSETRTSHFPMLPRSSTSTSPSACAAAPTATSRCRSTREAPVAELAGGRRRRELRAAGGGARLGRAAGARHPLPRRGDAVAAGAGRDGRPGASGSRRAPPAEPDAGVDAPRRTRRASPPELAPRLARPRA